jgi:hypothetical protein
LLPSGRTITGITAGQAFTAVCSAITGSTLPQLRLNSQAITNDRAMALNAQSAIGRWLCTVPTLLKSGTCPCAHTAPNTRLAMRQPHRRCRAGKT